MGNIRSEISCPHCGHPLDVIAEYAIIHKATHATRDMPAEGPEIEIVSVVHDDGLDTKMDIKTIDKHDWTQLYEAAYQDACENPPEMPEYDDDDRYPLSGLDR